MKEIVLPSIIKIEYLDNRYDIIKTSSNIWRWKNLGDPVIINWGKLKNIDTKLVKYFKAYLCYRFINMSISTISGDLKMIKSINEFNINFPFNLTNLSSNLISNGVVNNLCYLRSFYKWGLKYGYKDFNLEFYNALNEVKISNRKPYEKIFLNPIYFSSEEINKIYLKTKNYIYNNVDKNSLKNNIILHISYELAPRPSQLYKLNTNDFIIAKSDKKSYFSLNLPMSKKIKSKSLEKRHRSISSRLGIKIQFYLDKFKSDFNTNKPLFSTNSVRTSSQKISSIISNELKSLNIYNKSSIDLRHPERWVQGAIGYQYIGGIGSCGLPEDTSCPKNPVYACYTCIKFHPFKEGNHKLVKHNLENQAQLFIDIAEIGNDIEHNRPVTQLNTVISAVNNVINIIEKDYE